MARIKLSIPEKVLAVIQIPVRIYDINYGNHLGNDAFISIIHEARVQWLQQHNYTELNIEGIGLIMADLAVEFKSEGFYGDIIEVAISVAEISKAWFELYYSLSAKRKDEVRLLAIAKTGMVCYDYSLRKVAAMPQGLKTILGTSD